MRMLPYWTLCRRSPYRSPALPILVATLLVAVAAPGAGAAGFGVFQHGARGVAQAGALVARADDPSAVFYNPAGLVDLDGVQVAVGVDFRNDEDRYRERFDELDFLTGAQTRRYDANDAETSWDALPSVYLTWSDAERLGRWSFGLGVDTPFHYAVEWTPDPTSLGIRTSVHELELWQVHPVAAYRLGGGWSVGGGLRYVAGTHRRGAAERFLPFVGDLESSTGDVLDEHEADLDGWGFDLALRQRSESWGFGAVLRSAVRVEGDGHESFTVYRQPTDPEARRTLEGLLASIDGHPFTTRLDLPPELAVGAWRAFTPTLRAELDVVYTAWSEFEERRDGLDLAGNPYPLQVRVDGWDDTLAVRLGVETDLGPRWTVGAGLAREPSPVPQNRVESDWFRGDATVYGLGASYAAGPVTWDLAWSLHDHDAQNRTVVRPRYGSQYSRFQSETQLLSLAARFRL